MEINTKKRTAALVAACGLLGVAGTGAALAYLTDAEVTTNKFTVGDVSIEGVEPGWPGNDTTTPKDIVPNEEVEKNPYIQNTGVSDAVVFITVDSPIENITLIKDDGTVETSTAEGFANLAPDATGSAKGLREIFWFKDAADGKSVHGNKFDSTWQRLTTKEMYVKIDGATGAESSVSNSADALKAAYASVHPTDAAPTGKLVKRYVFGYKTVLQGSSANDGTPSQAQHTNKLFDKVQLKNMLENEIDENAEDVVIRYYAIQGSNVIEAGVDLTGAINEANLGKIYDIFVRQNSTNDAVDGLHLENLRNGDDTATTSNGASGTRDAHANRWGYEHPNMNENNDPADNSNQIVDPTYPNPDN